MSGLFILSLDTEIAWGTYGARKLSRTSHCFNVYRDLFPRLIALLDQYEVPATFAVVGHLFLESCNGHDEIPQPHYRWMPAPDSYRDPRSDVTRAPWYYGPDMIARIRAARMPHAVGTHTFTHVIAADPAVTSEMWDAQLQMCARIHARCGLPMRSLVYPQDKVAYVDRLPDYGIVAFRGVERRWYRSLPRRLQKAFHVLDRALGWTPATYNPSDLRVGERLVDLPASQFLMAYDGFRRYIPTSARVRQARKGLERAARRGEIFHLWFHPFNLGTSEKMFDALEQILRRVAEMRAEGRIEVMTMGQAADWILAGGPERDRASAQTKRQPA